MGGGSQNSQKRRHLIFERPLSSGHKTLKSSPKTHISSILQCTVSAGKKGRKFIDCLRNAAEKLQILIRCAHSAPENLNF